MSIVGMMYGGQNLFVLPTDMAAKKTHAAKLHTRKLNSAAADTQRWPTAQQQKKNKIHLWPVAEKKSKTAMSRI